MCNSEGQKLHFYSKNEADLSLVTNFYAAVYFLVSLIVVLFGQVGFEFIFVCVSHYCVVAFYLQS